MKKHLSTIILSLAFIIGLSLLLYPTLSDYVNSLHQSRAIAGYAEAVAEFSDEEYDQILQEAVEYNTALAKERNTWNLSDAEMAKYQSILNIKGTGMMSYIEIPKINCYLPIYHGTEDGTLQKSIGHIPGTSLPVGGASSHCVLSGHRGLPSAKLFSELDRMTEGDLFLIRTLDEVLTYEVDQILIVLPTETDALQIEQGKDYCTLVTCTPYGVNSHRLLVRGHRVENQNGAASIRVVADAMQIEPIIVAPLVATPILLLLLIAVMVKKPRRKNSIEEEPDDEDQ